MSKEKGNGGKWRNGEAKKKGKKKISECTKQMEQSVI